MQRSDGVMTRLSATPIRIRSYAQATPALAWALWGLSVVQVGAGLTLAALNHLTLVRLFAEFVVCEAAAGVAFATMGALVVTRRPRNRVGWLLCVTGLVSALRAWVGQYGRYTYVTAPGALPAGAFIVWLYFLTVGPTVALTAIFLPLLFPDVLLPGARWQPVLGLAVTATLLFTFVTSFSPGPVDTSLPEVANPFPLLTNDDARDALSTVATLLMFMSLLAALAAPVARLRRATGVEREQLKWFAYATALLIASFILGAAAYLSGGAGDAPVSGILLSFSLPFLPVAVGVAILRYHLYDIDVLINRTLVYGALTALIVGLYVLVVGYLGAIFHSQGNPWIALVATGVVAVIFQPLRDWLQRGVNRLLYGRRDEPYTVLSRLGQRLEGVIEPDAVLPTVVTTVRDALKLPYAAVALKQDNAFVLSAATGEPVGKLLTLPLVYQGDVVGQLRVCPRVADDEWSPADRRLLDDLAHHAGVAAHSVRVMTELQRARERLVLAREEERRRLRRDLHDDLAPSLAALGLTAASVEEMLTRDPVGAARALTKLRAAIRSAVADVRRLAYDLRPPALDELGLVEAIREQVAVFNATVDGERPYLTLDVPQPLPSLSAATEVAAYRIVQEALMNVVRHASARSCQIRLACPTPQTLIVEVSDDGVGLPLAARAGVGLRSMRERAEELGGTWDLESASGEGTRVVAHLPVGSTERQEAA